MKKVFELIGLACICIFIIGCANNTSDPEIGIILNEGDGDGLSSNDDFDMNLDEIQGYINKNLVDYLDGEIKFDEGKLMGKTTKFNADLKNDLKIEILIGNHNSKVFSIKFGQIASNKDLSAKKIDSIKEILAIFMEGLNDSDSYDNVYKAMEDHMLENGEKKLMHGASVSNHVFYTMDYSYYSENDQNFTIKLQVTDLASQEEYEKFLENV